MRCLAHAFALQRSQNGLKNFPTHTSWFVMSSPRSDLAVYHYSDNALAGQSLPTLATMHQGTFPFSICENFQDMFAMSIAERDSIKDSFERRFAAAPLQALSTQHRS